MTIIEAAILGLVQGLTEFLPISSSGHLVLFDKLLGMADQPLAFIVTIHMATLVAVVVFFWQELLRLKLRDMWILALGTIPAVLAALFFNNQIEAMFSSAFFAALTLVITGVINILIDRWMKKPIKSRPNPNHEALPLTIKETLWVGIAQAIAIIPGISRSGSTVATGIYLGMDRQLAFKLSFLLSIPAILGAMSYEILKHGTGDLSVFISPPYLAGIFTAFIGGMLSLKVFALVLNKAKLSYFGYYAIAVGVLVMGYMIFGLHTTAL